MYKKRLKIPNVRSEAVIRKRTDNTMAKIRSKGQTTIYKTLQTKLQVIFK